MSSFSNNTSGSFGTAGTTRDIEVTGVPLGAEVEVVVDAQPYDWSYTEAEITAPDGNTYVVWPDRTYGYSNARLTRTLPISYPETSDPNGTWTFLIRDTDSETGTLHSVQLNFTAPEPPSEPAESRQAMRGSFVSGGAAVDIVPSADVAQGQIVVQSDLVGVTKFAIQAGSLGAIAVRGVFDVVKDPSTNIDAGTLLYWSEVSQHVVKTEAEHPLFGKAIRDAPPGTTVVRALMTQ